MEAIEVLPGSNLIKFFGELEMDKLYKIDGIINGFAETPIEFTSFGSDLKFKVLSHYFLLNRKSFTTIFYINCRYMMSLNQKLASANMTSNSSTLTRLK